MKPHYSPSQLGMFVRCGMQWYHRYALGKKSPPGISATLGTAVDKTAEADLARKMQTGELMSTAEVIDTARDQAVALWKGGDYRLDEEEDKIATEGQLVDAAVSLSGLFHGNVAPHLTPQGLQVLRTPEPEGYDFTLKLYLDILEEHAIKDIKTKGKKPAEDSIDRGSYADQLTTYDLAEPRGQVGLLYLVNVKKPYHLSLTSSRDENDHARVLDKYQRMHEAVTKGVFMPADAESWICSERWCGYYNECPHGSRNVKLVPVSRLRREPEPTPQPEPFSIDW